MLKEPDRREGRSCLSGQLGQLEQLEDSEKGVWEKWGKWRAGISGPGNEPRKMKDGLIGRWSEFHIRLW